MLKNAKSILVTGGTGSFGQKFIQTILKDYHPERLIIFSRDELKQHEMQVKFKRLANSPLRFFLGDVRDKARLDRAFHDVDIVVHAAALKQVPACEYNPIEAINTNIVGAKNIIEAAIDQGVKKVIALSTDKAVNPANLYGATKLCAEKLFVQGNSYSGSGGPIFSCVRYGNVVGSRGSVIPLFREQRPSGKITITDSRMTRFWITLQQGVDFVRHCLDHMHGGEIFVPKIPSMNIMDLVKAFAPECTVENIGIRQGEKLHEALIGEDESRNTSDMGNMYVVKPTHPWWNELIWKEGKSLPEGFRYTSDNNTEWLTVDQLKQLADVI
ncbi:MAG: UDP-N-acetylglucosamine 4,6-dehydratase (inverting) [Chthoniobacterales bacterium]